MTTGFGAQAGQKTISISAGLTTRVLAAPLDVIKLKRILQGYTGEVTSARNSVTLYAQYLTCEKLIIPDSTVKGCTLPMAGKTCWMPKAICESTCLTLGQNTPKIHLANQRYG
jgi:hypothetical protein